MKKYPVYSQNRTPSVFIGDLFADVLLSIFFLGLTCIKSSWDIDFQHFVDSHNPFVVWVITGFSSSSHMAMSCESFISAFIFFSFLCEAFSCARICRHCACRIIMIMQIIQYIVWVLPAIFWLPEIRALWKIMQMNPFKHVTAESGIYPLICNFIAPCVNFCVCSWPRKVKCSPYDMQHKHSTLLPLWSVWKKQFWHSSDKILGKAVKNLRIVLLTCLGW